MTLQKLMRHVALIVSIVSCTVASNTTYADVTVPAVFGDNMVIQRELPIKVWGWAEPNESVTVSINGVTASDQADQGGKWNVTVAPQPAASEPIEFWIKGNNHLQFKNVLIGEVWLCSGQSNMEWSVRQSKDATSEIANAKHPLIRHIKVPRKPENTPQSQFKAEWQVCSPDTAANFTACGYYMARELHKELGVPIGLVNSSWGGTRVEPWTPVVGFKHVPALQSIYEDVQNRTPGTATQNQRLAEHIKSLELWIENAKAANENPTPLQPHSPFPTEITPYRSHQDPTRLYNGMIHPLVGFPIRGAIWYQGESNRSDGMMYFEKKKALINGWRELWDQGEFPFYFVQIAPFRYGQEHPKILAEFWEAQEATLQVPNTKMVVTNDIATINDIHPPDKQSVGKRLANLALKFQYGRTELVAESPTMKSVSASPGKLTVEFKNTGGGLKTRNGGAPTHFEVAGKGVIGFQPANARIEGDAVVLTSEKITDPTAFRFAWNKLSEPNLMGGTGLPVGAVRGGEVPKFSDTLPLGDYELVYDLDLSKLSPKLKYEVDRSAEIKSFDRIGYLVELGRASGEEKLFVSMDAFTDKISHIGIPTFASGAFYQTEVKNLEVISTTSASFGKLERGVVEFWPSNYSPEKKLPLPGASNSLFDFGDTPAAARANGYGSMQVHDLVGKKTLFAINNWNKGTDADIGIGNCPGQHPDWTFSGSAKDYTSKRLRVYVRATK